MPLLAPGEMVVLSERTESGSGRDGILTLTNIRIIFEARKQRGLIAQAVRGEQLVTLLDLALTQLSNVHRDKPLLGRATLRIEAGGGSYGFHVGDAEAWANTIRSAHQQAPRPHAYGYGAPVVVNVNQAAPPPPPPPETYLHCTHCGSLVRPGAAGPALHCTSCGARL